METNWWKIAFVLILRAVLLIAFVTLMKEQDVLTAIKLLGLLVVAIWIQPKEPEV
jgi:hypothetical protein